MNSLPPVNGLTLTGGYALAAIPARYALELGNWQDASNLQASTESVPWAQAITWMAIGIGSARSKHMDRAAQAEQALASLRDATNKQNNTYWANQIEVQRREVTAWIADANGKPEDALMQMRAAAELEESMDKNAVTPGAVTPAREMLAQLLAAQKRPAEALTEYEAVLKIAPKRFNAVYGAAVAAEAAGNASASMKYFQELIDSATGDERQELVSARKKVAENKVASSK
jgi:tetratricopeptide (TPR) repeat protein